MLLDLNVLIQQFELKIKGILHVGAHLAEEASLYRDLGIHNVYWIEGNPDNMPAIERTVDPLGHRAINALISDKDREPTTFHITNYDSMSSSVLEFGTHTTFSPETVFVEHRVLESRTLDSLWDEYKGFSGVNFLNMDLQGAELMALQGAENLIPQLDYIYSEVNCKEVYKGCAQVGDLDTFLQRRGFLRMQTGWVGDQGWGDALYVRSTNAL